jgi:hypothetical protein
MIFDLYSTIDEDFKKDDFGEPQLEEVFSVETLSA